LDYLLYLHTGSLIPGAVRETSCLMKFNGIQEATKISEKRTAFCGNISPSAFEVHGGKIPII